jgi:hypothetical protein
MDDGTAAKAKGILFPNRDRQFASFRCLNAMQRFSHRSATPEGFYLRRAKSHTTGLCPSVTCWLR